MLIQEPLLLQNAISLLNLLPYFFFSPLFPNPFRFRFHVTWACDLTLLFNPRGNIGNLIAQVGSSALFSCPVSDLILCSFSSWKDALSSWREYPSLPNGCSLYNGERAYLQFAATKFPILILRYLPVESSFFRKILGSGPHCCLVPPLSFLGSSQARDALYYTNWISLYWKQRATLNKVRKENDSPVIGFIFKKTFFILHGFSWGSHLHWLYFAVTEKQDNVIHL